MKPELVSENRLESRWDEYSHATRTPRWVTSDQEQAEWDMGRAEAFEVGARAALEEVGVVEVKEVEPCGRLEECQREQRRVGQLRCAWVAFCPDKGPVLVRLKKPDKSP